MKRIATALFLFSGICFSNQITFVGQPAYFVTGGGKQIPVYKEARLFYPGAPAGGSPAFLTGAGLRRKKVSFVTADVYVIASYVEDLTAFNAADPLNSIAEMGERALHLTLVRDVTATQVRESFEDSLVANKVDIKKAGIQSLLSAITDMPNGSSVSFVALNDVWSDTLTMESSAGKASVSEDMDLARDFWSSWFGTPVDPLMAALKQKLIGK